MKTLADFKRKIQLGVKIDTYNHFTKKEMGIREISIVQSKLFAIATLKNY